MINENDVVFHDTEYTVVKISSISKKMKIYFRDIKLHPTFDDLEKAKAYIDKRLEYIKNCVKEVEEEQEDYSW